MAGRSPLIVGVVAAVLIVGFGAREFLRGSKIDSCATQIADAAKSGADTRVREMIDSAALRGRLTGADDIEVVFVRPANSEWARVGLAARTATVSELVVLLLDNSKLPKCRFLRDYDHPASLSQD